MTGCATAEREEEERKKERRKKKEKATRVATVGPNDRCATGDREGCCELAERSAALEELLHRQIPLRCRCCVSEVRSSRRESKSCILIKKGGNEVALVRELIYNISDRDNNKKVAVLFY